MWLAAAAAGGRGDSRRILTNMSFTADAAGPLPCGVSSSNISSSRTIVVVCNRVSGQVPRTHREG